MAEREEVRKQMARRYQRVPKKEKTSKLDECI
jgi:hypothetical protein